MSSIIYSEPAEEIINSPSITPINNKNYKPNSISSPLKKFKSPSLVAHTILTRNGIYKYICIYIYKYT